jgi:DNA-binding NtrC family response regulator
MVRRVHHEAEDQQDKAMAHDILIVDDERDICTLIAGILEDEGYSARRAHSSTEALEAIAHRRPSLVILDVWLQGSELDGVEVLKVIRRGRSRETLPVLLMLNENKSAPSPDELESWGVNASVGKVRGIGGIVDSVCQYLEDRKLVEQPN